MMIAVRLVFLYAAYNVYSYNQHSGYSRLDERLCKMMIMIPRSDSGAGEEVRCLRLGTDLPLHFYTADTGMPQFL